MAGITDVPGVEIWGRGRGEFTLPCGFIDGAGKVHKNIILREMTGVEEDMLDDDDVSKVERITSILCACTEKIGDTTNPEEIRQVIADEMPAGRGITSTDRIAAMIFLRRVSVGDLYKFQRRCPRCGHVTKNRSVDLTRIKMKEIPEERVGKRRVEVVLPRTKQKCVLRVMTARHEHKVVELRPTSKELRTAAMSARVEQIGEARFVNNREAFDALKALPQKDRLFIRRVYDLMEADVDTEVEVVCDSMVCGAEWTFPLDVGQVFFSNPEDVGVTEAELKWL